MDVPGSYVALAYPSTPDPVVARPFGVGDLAEGAMELTLALPEFSGPVDVYGGMLVPFLDPRNVYQFPSLAKAGPVKWVSGATGPVRLTLFGGSFPTTLLTGAGLRGVYRFYVVVTPAGKPGLAM